MFLKVRYRKKACTQYLFLYTNMDLRKSQICIFAKGLVHGFSQKREISSSFLFRKNEAIKGFYERSIQ